MYRPGYIRHRLGVSVIDNSWHTINRNFDADIKKYENDNSVISINAFFIYGSGKIDDMYLYNSNNPIISLNGPNELSIQQGFSYRDGTTASDYKDGDISQDICINGVVNSNIIGNYLLTYNVVDSDGNPAYQAHKTVYVISTDKIYGLPLPDENSAVISAADLLITTSASSLSQHRSKLSLNANIHIDAISNYSFMLLNKGIYWNDSQDGSFIWQPGIRKNSNDYKYAGKINGSYQAIPTDERCSIKHEGEDFYENSETCNLLESVVDRIGLDTSHYLAKWPVFYNALKNSYPIGSAEYVYYNEILVKDAIQIKRDPLQVEVEDVAQFHQGIWQTTNYMDTTNGVYRWNYSNRGKDWGYDSYGFPYIFGFSSIGFSGSQALSVIYEDIITNLSNYPNINEQSKDELLILLSLLFNENNPQLTCTDINQYQECKEKFIFKNSIIPELQWNFTIPATQTIISNNQSIASYNKIVGQHHLVMQYAFKHDILEWKQEYYKYFFKFSTQVIDTNAIHFNNLDSTSNVKWNNLNSYYESHFMLWASAFLLLSSQYDGNFDLYPNYSQGTEIKIRSFIEQYVITLYNQNIDGLNFKVTQ